MSERSLKEFRERAVLLVPVPDFEELQRRGTARRRVRLAAGAALLASVLAIGGTVVATTIDEEQAIEPAQIGPRRINPPPSSAEACELVVNAGAYGSVPSGCELLAQVDQWLYIEPGRYFVRPFNTDLRPPRAGDLEAWFEHPGGLSHWYWWGGGVSMAGRGPEFAPYIRVAITPITGVPRLGEQCQGVEPRRVWALPASVISVAEDLVASPGITVLEPPSTVQKFGYDAAHVRFAVTERCSGDEVFVLWRAFEPEADIYLEENLSKPDRRDGDIVGVTGNVFDVWVLDVQGKYLVISADHPDSFSKINSFEQHSEEHLAMLQKLLNSIRLEVTE